MIVRRVAPADFAAAREVLCAAFGREGEAEIVEAVRRAGEARVEFVAVDGAEVIGHVLFSRMTTRPPIPVAALGPLSVRPDRQSQGAGAALVRRGLAACRELGDHAVVVLGDPRYYSRFGFARASDTVRSPYSGRDAFMANALVAGALDSPIDLAYPAAFA